VWTWGKASLGPTRARSSSPSARPRVARARADIPSRRHPRRATSGSTGSPCGQTTRGPTPIGPSRCGHLDRPTSCRSRATRNPAVGVEKPRQQLTAWATRGVSRSRAPQCSDSSAVAHRSTRGRTMRLTRSPTALGHGWRRKQPELVQVASRSGQQCCSSSAHASVSILVVLALGRAIGEMSLARSKRGRTLGIRQSIVSLRARRLGMGRVM
jgi:hypothetical protein